MSMMGNVDDGQRDSVGRAIITTNSRIELLAWLEPAWMFNST
jgi:hypothetical protein